jgi:hypothetical protein
MVVLSQKPPKLLCYHKNRQAVALSQKPPTGCVISKTAKRSILLVNPSCYEAKITKRVTSQRTKCYFYKTNLSIINKMLLSTDEGQIKLCMKYRIYRVSKVFKNRKSVMQLDPD